MEPCERIIHSVKHMTPDRPPIDYNATPEAHSKLKGRLGIEDDEILLRRLGVDIRRAAGRCRF